jgi:DNA-binding MarR family transcriptional regulator
MTSDSVDRMIQTWAATNPSVDARPLEVVGRLLLCAEYCQRALTAALQPFELSFGDFDVINTLRRRADADGANPSDLARSSLITTGAMTARLDRLSRAGLIRRAPDPADGRAVRVHLTERGHDLAVSALEAVLAADETFLQPLNGKQRDEVAALLRVLLAAHES